MNSWIYGGKEYEEYSFRFDDGITLFSNGYNTCWLDVYSRCVRRMALHEKVLKEMI